LALVNKEMNEMSKEPTNSATKMSSSALLYIFLAIALSLAALVLAVTIFPKDDVLASYILLLGFVGIFASVYVLLQMRKRVRRLSIESHPITTTIECKKCGFKSIREFKRGDYIFKEEEPCQKCNEKMMITAIFREVKEGEKERFRF
jgi:heme/copper-type cytochrome/quinol oxidase subunit 4